MKISRYTGIGLSNHRLYPPSVFLIHSLVTLEMRFYSIRDIDWRFPKLIVLPNLKKLYLSELDYADLGRLLGCCQALEDLSLSIDIPQESVVLITSKSLKRLAIKLEGKSIRDVIVDTPILEQLDYCSNSVLSIQMLDSIPNVKSLKLRTGSPTRFNNFRTTLSELIRLELSLNSEIFQAIFDQQMMHCPNLEVLVLDFFGYYEITWNQEAMFMLVQQVKHIELCAYVDRFSKYGLSLVIWLLRSAPVLKKLVISGYGTLPSDDSLSKFRNIVLKCAENTSCCQIDFLGLYKLDIEVQAKDKL
ncbi:FBD-associated F-box protein At5g60610-like [Silene latifolia]|uniref:FBD-associated F-box protein At5g60610-like n=1 Tax=Silene latifolia TaxID=37657 RepID=UPI003D781571